MSAPGIDGLVDGFVVCVTFTVAPSHRSSFMDAMMRQAANSLAKEPACSRFDVCIDPADVNRIFLYEFYDDEPAFKVHLASDHFVAFDALVRDWVVDKQVAVWHRRQGQIPS